MAPERLSSTRKERRKSRSSPNADFGTFMEALEHVQRRSSVEALEPERLRGVVLSLARHYETVWRDPQAMVAWINDRRKTSGFPPVTNVGRIREEIENASRRYRSIIAATFNSFTRLECREIVTRVIDEATTSGGTLAPALVYDVIVDYQVGAAEELERGREVIAAYVERIETAIREGNVGQVGGGYCWEIRGRCATLGRRSEADANK